MKTPSRRCVACGAPDPVAADAPVWPPKWQCPACGYAIGQQHGISLFAPELADTISGMDPANFSYLAEVEEEHFWFVARRELIVGLLSKFFPQARSFLEVGCGSGGVLRAIAASRKWDRLAG